MLSKPRARLDKKVNYDEGIMRPSVISSAVRFLLPPPAQMPFLGDSCNVYVRRPAGVFFLFLQRKRCFVSLPERESEHYLEDKSELANAQLNY